MDNQLTKEYTVLTSTADAEGKLSIRGIFDLFMDMAAEHAGKLGVGYKDMLERGCFWVAVRTRICLYRRPAMGQTVRCRTWPGTPGFAKSERYYRMTAGDEVLAEGRTEWAVQDLETGSVRRTDSYGWPSIEPLNEKTCPGPFTRFKPLTEGEILPARVGSMDIDTGHHMNNVAYIRMLLGTFTTAELSAMEAREVEVSYRAACYEGERLSIRRKLVDGVWLFQIEKEDGTIAVQAAIRCGVLDTGENQ